MQKLNHRIRFLALAAACSLGACATQTYQAQPLAAATAEASFRARSLDSAELRDYLQAQGVAVPVAAWGLHELTLAALHFHPQLDQARARLGEARAALQSAGAKPNPGLSAGAEHHSRAEGGISPWTLGFSFDIPIETGGKREIRIAQATHLSEAARLDIARSAWEVRSRLRDRLLDICAANDQEALLQREIDLRSEIVAMLEQRLAAGMISSVELGSAKLQLLKARQGLESMRGRLPELHAQLAAAAGLPASALATAPLDPSALRALPAWEALPAQEVQRSALLNRLDLRGALSRYAAAESALQLEIAKQRPDITLSPGYSFDQGDNRWALGLSLILALLDKREGPIAEATAHRAAEAADFNALQARVIAEQEQALARYRAALQAITAAQRTLQSQQQQHAQTLRQFEAGYSDRLELTSAQLEALAAEQGLLDSRLSAQRALGTLEQALQLPLDQTTLPGVPETEEPHA